MMSNRHDNEIMKLLDNKVEGNFRQIYLGQDGNFYITYNGGDVPIDQFKKLEKHRGIVKQHPDCPDLFISKKWRKKNDRSS
ncbi:hypothetical protein QE357_000370 [Siphonobacter sp. BAB-5404]|nr:hypothetical protein [Siphonobacter sp. SORGH_AS_0500]